MKIGILTYYGGLNYGTTLQGYAVYNLIKEYFPNSYVEFIAVRDFQEPMRPCVRQTTIRGFINDLHSIRKFKNFIKVNMDFSKDKLYTKNFDEAINYINDQNYDAIFVGSDTILEFKSYHKGSSIPFYWLAPEIKAKKFFISASSRNLSYDNLSPSQIKKLLDSVRDYALLGVRDDATYRLIYKLAPNMRKKLKIIPDPTFCLDVDYKYVEDYIQKKRIDTLYRPIACIHTLKNDKWSKKLAESLKNKGYIVASIRTLPYADILLNDLGPLEYMGIMKYFKIFITHRFHDSVFCFKNKTPVVTYTPSSKYDNIAGESKYTSLFKIFNMNDSLITQRDLLNSEKIIDKMEHTLSIYDKDFVDTKLVELKRKLHEYMIEVRKCI